MKKLLILVTLLLGIASAAQAEEEIDWAELGRQAGENIANKMKAGVKEPSPAGADGYYNFADKYIKIRVPNIDKVEQVISKADVADFEKDLNNYRAKKLKAGKENYYNIVDNDERLEGLSLLTQDRREYLDNIASSNVSKERAKEVSRVSVIYEYKYMKDKYNINIFEADTKIPLEFIYEIMLYFHILKADSDLIANSFEYLINSTCFFEVAMGVDDTNKTATGYLDTDGKSYYITYNSKQAKQQALLKMLELLMQ